MAPLDALTTDKKLAKIFAKILCADTSKVYEGLSTDDTSSDGTRTNFLCNSNNTEINTYYVYGLTFMNGLLIIISIALVLLVFDDKNKKQN
jgi:hypothetical protein